MFSVLMLGLLCGVGASTIARAAGGSSPCGILAQNSASGTTTATAKLAYDCLTSIPLNKEAAVALVESILPYVEWQSDLEFLEAPPKGYQEPPIDVIGSLQEIIREIKKGGYDNEHEFQAGLFQTFNAVHDGHFRFVPDLLSKVAFRRRVQLVSVSRDGVELPRVYVKSDMFDYTTSANFSASAVTRINGQDANRYLQDVAQFGFLQDPDALYNTLFYELAIDAQYANMQYTGGFAGAGRASMIYQGAETRLDFANGTSRTYENYAEVIGNWNRVTDGPSAYEKFCTGPKTYDPATDDEEFMAGDVGYAHGYPTAKGISSDKQIAGYFLDDDPAFKDVAVLSMLSFEPFYPAEFQNVIERFIYDAKAAGKSKIVIDLSGNGGGIILNGYDAFRQFFPQTVQDGFSRFREHDAFNIMSKQISNFTSGFSLESASTTQVVASQSVLDYRFDLNQTNLNFLTYDDKFRPQKFRHDNYTSLLRWNLSDPLLTTSWQYGLGMEITGYGDRQGYKQPFAAEDIIMVYDGYCASTCAIFSEFMRTQGHVKSIAFGGRPNRSPIQAVGGTKGTNNYPFSYILTLANIALSTASPEQSKEWQSVKSLSQLPLNRSSDSSINVRDMILRDNIKDGTPAQFLYEAADCRLFYEPEMLRDASAIWKKAASVAWGSGKCVAGSLPHEQESRKIRRRKTEELRVRVRSERVPGEFRAPSGGMEGVKRVVFGKKVPL